MELPSRLESADLHAKTTKFGSKIKSVSARRVIEEKEVTAYLNVDRTRYGKQTGASVFKDHQLMELIAEFVHPTQNQTLTKHHVFVIGQLKSSFQMKTSVTNVLPNTFPTLPEMPANVFPSMSKINMDNVLLIVPSSKNTTKPRLHVYVSATTKDKMEFVSPTVKQTKSTPMMHVFVSAEPFCTGKVAKCALLTPK